MNPLSRQCDDAHEGVLASLDGLTVEQDNLEAHLNACADCRTYASEMADLLGSLRTLEQEPVPAGLTDRIMERVAAEAPSNVVPLKRKLLSRKYASIAAVTLLIALAVPLMLRPGTQDAGQYVARAPQSVQVTQEEPPAVVSVEQPPVKIAEAPAVSEPANVASSSDMPSATAHKPVSSQRSEPALPTMAKSPHPVAAVKAPAPKTQPAPQPVASAAEQLLASAIPEEAFASEEEGDVYYDPLSEFVGF